MAASPSDIARTLWRCHKRFGEGNPPTVVRGVFSRQLINELPRPWEDDDKRFAVTLADGPVLVRTSDFVDAKKLYQSVPRTRLFESVHTREGEWQADVAALLAAWLDYDVLSSVYEAGRDDQALPEHSDAWDNIVLQLAGTKRWKFGTDEIVLEVGDVLIVPTGTTHLVRTDDYSVHINFEVVDPVVVQEYMSRSTDFSPERNEGR